jgi:Rieske Fe-S protein
MTSNQGRARVTRRGVLAGAAAVGVGTAAAGALAACGDGSGSDPSAQSTGPLTVPVADIPVGGAAIAGQVIVSQPSAGEFRAFSAVCTHEFCLISRVRDTTLECTCHGSQFSTTDGSVLRGPAQRPLDGRTVTVDGETLTVT